MRTCRAALAVALACLGGCNHPPHGHATDMVVVDDLAPIALPDEGVPQRVDHWPKQLASLGDDRILAMTTDAKGNLFVAGNFSDALPAEWGGAKAFGGRDVVVAKMRPAGAIEWVRTLGGEGHDLGLALTLTAEGDVIVTGAFEFTANFGGPSLLTSAGSFDVFLLRLRGSDGQPQWSRRVGGGPYRDVGYGVAVSSQNDIYVVGRFFGVAQIAGVQLTSMGDWDAFIAAYDESGKTKWAHQGGAIGDDYFSAVTTLANGDAVAVGDVTARTGWTIAFDGKSLAGHGSTENHDAVVARYGRDGSIAWVTSSPDDYTTYARSAVNDGSDGILVSGFAQGNFIFGIDSKQYGSSYVARFGSDGTVATVMPLAIASNAVPIAKSTPLVIASSIAVAPGGGIVAGGAFDRGILYQSTFTPPMPAPTDYSSYARAGYLATETAGTKQGFVPFLASDDTHVDAVAAAPDGTVYAAVTYSGTVQLPDGPATAAGGADATIVRLVYPTTAVSAAPLAETAPPQPQSGTSKCVAPPPPAKPGPVGPMPTFTTSPVVLPSYKTDFIQATAIDLHGHGSADVLVNAYTCDRCNKLEYGGPLFVLEDDMGMLRDATSSLLRAPFDYWGTSNPPFIAKDFDGDGLTDLFAGQAAYDTYPEYGDLPILLMQQPDGTLRDDSAARIPIDPHMIDPTYAPPGHYFDAGDIDCSGRPAAIVMLEPAADEDYSPRLLINDGHGRLLMDQRTRLDPALFADNPVQGRFLSAVFCDVNTDGAADLVMGADYGVSDSKVFLNDGFGHFIEKPNALPAPPFNGMDSLIYLVCVDVNRDGHNDIVFHDTKGYQQELTGLWLNNGDGTFSSTPDDTIPEPVYGRPIFAVDLNGDGWPDLVGAGQADFGTTKGSLFAALNNGDGTFKDASSIFPMQQSFSYGIAPFDVNHDGKPDLLVLFSDSNTAYVLTNTTR